MGSASPAFPPLILQQILFDGCLIHLGIAERALEIAMPQLFANRRYWNACLN
jgi:hypothetical protein